MSNKMHECCLTGFHWDGTPAGRETQLGEHQTYVTGSNKEHAILFCHDGFGWTFNNTRLLADHFAQEVGATVYVPDFFHGNPVPVDCINNVKEGDKFRMARSPDFDWDGWFATNAVDVRMPEILASARLIRSQYPKLGAVGYCWGGAAMFKLASKQHEGLVNCVSMAHPGAPTKNDVYNIGVPIQILAPEYDEPFPAEWRDFCNLEIPKLGVEYYYQYFPGQTHGFAVRCNDIEEGEKRALELAKNAMVYWLLAHLH